MEEGLSWCWEPTLSFIGSSPGPHVALSSGSPGAERLGGSGLRGSEPTLAPAGPSSRPAPRRPPSHGSHCIPTGSRGLAPFHTACPASAPWPLTSSALACARARPASPATSLGGQGHLSTWWHLPLFHHRAAFLGGTDPRGFWGEQHLACFQWSTACVGQDYSLSLLLLLLLLIN